MVFGFTLETGSLCVDQAGLEITESLCLPGAEMKVACHYACKNEHWLIALTKTGEFS